MLKFLPYEVVLWHRIESSPPGLHEHIIEHAGRSPDEGVQSDGLWDMHWGFHSVDAAISFAESLFEVAASDDLILLTVNAKNDEEFGRRVYKDSRTSMKCSL